MYKSNAASFCLFSRLSSFSLLRNENVGMGFPLLHVDLALYENHCLAILDPELYVWIKLSSFRLSSICDFLQNGLT